MTASVDNMKQREIPIGTHIFERELPTAALTLSLAVKIRFATRKQADFTDLCWQRHL